MVSEDAEGLPPKLLIVDAVKPRLNSIYVFGFPKEGDLLSRYFINLLVWWPR